MIVEIYVVNAHAPLLRVLLNKYRVSKPVRVKNLPDEPGCQYLGNLFLDRGLLI
jgi:hypothetical protein